MRNEAGSVGALGIITSRLRWPKMTVITNEIHISQCFTWVDYRIGHTDLTLNVFQWSSDVGFLQEPYNTDPVKVCLVVYIIIQKRHCRNCIAVCQYAIIHF